MAIPFRQTDTKTSAGGGAATLTLAALATRHYVVHHIFGSYSAAPTGGGLSITVGGNTVFSADITAAGPFDIWFEPSRSSANNQAVVIATAAGGGAVVARLNVDYEVW